MSGSQPVEFLHMGGEDRDRRGKFTAQVGERNIGTLGDLGQAHGLDRFLGEQRHEGGDDLLARRACDGRRGTGARGAGFGTGGLAGHDATPM
jgi:hypothetical protein